MVKFLECEILDFNKHINKYFKILKKIKKVSKIVFDFQKHFVKKNQKNYTLLNDFILMILLIILNKIINGRNIAFKINYNIHFLFKRTFINLKEL